MYRNYIIMVFILVFQVNFQEESVRAEDVDKGDASVRTRGARKPLTMFKGTLLDVRCVNLLPLSSCHMHTSFIFQLPAVKSVSAL